MTRRDTRLLLALASCVGATACGGGHDNNGPGLPACTRAAGVTDCTASWSGAVSGSTACNQITWSASGGWAFSLDGTTPNELIVQLSLPATPAAGQTFTMGQLKSPVVQLSDVHQSTGKTWWGATPNIGGDILFHVDDAGPSSANGSLAGSLVKGSGGSDEGVQICITF